MLMERGTIVRWNSDKGFGFIKPDTANVGDVFIHISILKQMARKPVVGDQMMYHTELQSDGRVKAVKANIEGVAVIASTSSRKAHKPNNQRRNNHYQRQSKSSSRLLIPLLILLGLGIFGFNKYEEMTATPVLTNKDVEQMQFNPVQNFRCEAGKLIAVKCDLAMKLCITTSTAPIPRWMATMMACHVKGSGVIKIKRSE